MTLVGNGDEDFRQKDLVGGNEETEKEGLNTMFMYEDRLAVKGKRRKNIERKYQDRDDDFVFEKRVKKPRRNKINYYDYNSDEGYS